MSKAKGYKVAIRAPVNGRVHRADIEIRDGAGALVTTDKADLGSMLERGRAAKRLAERLGADFEELREQLETGWAGAVEAAREEERSAQERQEQEAAAGPEDVDGRAERLLAEMPADVRQEAADYLRDPDLLSHVGDDIEALGVAGEKRLATGLYLVAVSRLEARPLAAIAKGPSSSGKSFVVEQVARLFPPEAVLSATSLTPQSLYYMAPGALSHRWVVAGERSRREDDDSAEATRALREMISSGRLSKLIPVKDGDRLQTALIEQEGPIAYVESTTRERVFDEDENRLLSLHTDERPAQTESVVERLAAAAAGKGGTDSAAIIRRHHAAQRLLRRSVVLIPYAPSLGELIPKERVEVRRAFPQLLGMVRALTLLHQFQRDRDDAGRLIATKTDYEWAQWLLAAPMTRLLGGGVSKAAMRFLQRLKKWGPQLPFTTTEARRREKVGKTAVCEWLKELNEAGLVELVSAGHGTQAASWRLNHAGDGTPEAASVLPTVDVLFPRVGAENGGRK